MLPYYSRGINYAQHFFQQGKNARSILAMAINPTASYPSSIEFSSMREYPTQQKSKIETNAY